MRCPAAGRAAGRAPSPEPLTGSPRVVQQARVAMRARGRSPRALFTSEGRAGSQGARARLCLGGGTVAWAQGRVAAVCTGQPRAASHPLLQLQSTVSVFLVVTPVGCWLNLSFAETELCKDRSGVSLGPELGAVVPQQCPCEAWWQVCPAELMPSATSPSRMAPRRPPRRPSHRPASARSGRGYRLVPMPQAAEWTEGVARRERGFRVFKVCWPRCDVLASRVGSQVERPVCVRCRKPPLLQASSRTGTSCTLCGAGGTTGTPVVPRFLTSALPLAGTMQVALGFS